MIALYNGNTLEERQRLEDLKFKCVSYLFLFCILFWFMILAFHIHVVLGLIFAFIEIYIAYSCMINRRKIKKLAEKMKSTSS